MKKTVFKGRLCVRNETPDGEVCVVRCAFPQDSCLPDLFTVSFWGNNKTNRAYERFELFNGLPVLPATGTYSDKGVRRQDYAGKTNVPQHLRDSFDDVALAFYEAGGSIFYMLRLLNVAQEIEQPRQRKEPSFYIKPESSSPAINETIGTTT
jgi:hypothetical protein